MAFRSEEYAWSDIKVFLGDRPVTGIRGLNYKLTRTVNKIYAAGNDPHSRTKGNKDYEGSITLLQSEKEALQEAAAQAGHEDITDLEFGITVSYAPELSDRIKTDQLISCVITELDKGMEQNDSNMEVELPLDIGKIKYNV